MKKNLVPIKASFFIAFLLFSCNQNNDESAYFDLNLHGEVNTLIEIEYMAFNYNDAVLKGTVKSTEITLFDRNGRITNKYYPQNGLFSKYEYVYDDRGNKVEEYKYLRNRLAYRYEYRYDEKRNMIESRTYSFDGPIISKYSHKYRFNEKGNVIEEKQYNSTGIHLFTNSSDYDALGNLLELTKIQHYNDGSSEKEVTKYDVNGNVLEETSYNINGIPYRKTSYKYDEKRNIVEKRHYRLNNELISILTYEYSEYDSKGNWIQRVEYANDSLYSYTERIINYY